MATKDPSLTGKTVRALLIKPDSDGELIELDLMLDIRQVLGVSRCAFFALMQGANAFCDDEGRLNGSARNRVATYLAWRLGYKGEIFGPVLIFGYDDEGESTDVPEVIYANWYALTQIRYRLRLPDDPV